MGTGDRMISEPSTVLQATQNVPNHGTLGEDFPIFSLRKNKPSA